jgi:hypothetical protein
MEASMVVRYVAHILLGTT